MRESNWNSKRVNGGKSSEGEKEGKNEKKGPVRARYVLEAMGCEACIVKEKCWEGGGWIPLADYKDEMGDGKASFGMISKNGN